MTKSEAVKLLGGGKHFVAAELLGLSKGAFSMWPENLTKQQEDRVIGAAVREKIILTSMPDEPSDTRSVA